jgi:D-serine deaminase-like pyridoxal phosphate-dependent protein
MFRIYVSFLHAIIISMAAQKLMLSDFALDDSYLVSGSEEILTPALIVYPDVVASNIERTVQLLGGQPERWRVHIKTAKLQHTLEMLIERRVRNFKCATTLELLVACQSHAEDVLLAYPVTGVTARRVKEIAAQFPTVRVSVLAENEAHIQQCIGTDVGVFLDINPGMNRTGIYQNDTERITQLVRIILKGGVQLRGLHYYDGQFGSMPEPERTRLAHQGYAHLMGLVSAIESLGTSISEVVTSGTPTLPCSLSFESFHNGNFLHRVSPGTVVYGDATSLAQLPHEYGYRPAVLILTRVVSHPSHGIVTCDGGHKAVSADAGVPTCVVAGHPDLTPLPPSEEHLPMTLKNGAVPPPIGGPLYLLPRHVCPTVNSFDHALLVKGGTLQSLTRVTARGHESPLPLP